MGAVDWLRFVQRRRTRCTHGAQSRHGRGNAHCCRKNRQIHGRQGLQGARERVTGAVHDDSQTIASQSEWGYRRGSPLHVQPDWLIPESDLRCRRDSCAVTPFAGVSIHRDTTVRTASGHSGCHAAPRRLSARNAMGTAITGIRLATGIDRRGRSDGCVKICGRFRAEAWPVRTIVMCRARFLQKTEHVSCSCNGRVPTVMALALSFPAQEDRLWKRVSEKVSANIPSHKAPSATAGEKKRPALRPAWNR